MSVLENLRKGTDSTSTRLLIGMVLLVFIFWGVGSGKSDKTSIYAEVNGVSITDTEFRRAYSMAARAMGRNLEDEEREALATRVLDGLIEEEALVQQAEELGIAVSDEEVAREVVKNEPFFGPDGKFDEKTYQKTLKQNGMTRASFESRIRRNLLVQRLVELAARGVNVTDAELKDAYVRRGTTVDLTFIRLPESAFLADIAIPDADRDAYVQQNGDVLKKRYEEAFEQRYNLPKRFELSTILLRTDIAGVDKEAVRAKAEQVRADAAKGADFAELAKRWSEDLTASNGGSLGSQASSQLDPVIVAAAEKAGVGNVTEVAETGRGFQILRVEKIEDARVVPLEEARNDLAVAMLREQKVGEIVNAYASQIISAWQASGAPPRDLTEPKRLSVDTTGPFSLEEPVIPRIGDVPALRAVLSTSPVGQVVPVMFTVKGTVFVVAVGARTDADLAQFETLEPMLRSQLLAQRQSEYVQEWRADVIAQSKITRAAKL